MKRRTILVFAGYYIPGYRSGGAVRTVANVVERLSEYYDFKIIAYDHDYGSRDGYKEIESNSWNKIGDSKVFYTDFTVSIKDVIKNTDFDVYYLNSFFGYNFSIKIILLRYFKCIGNRKVIIAPRGEFGEGALTFKKIKKKLFIMAAKVSGFYRDVLWQATSKYEAEQIKRIFGEEAKIEIVMDVPDFGLLKADINSKSSKQEGKLRILYLSVIHPIKNLRFILEVLKEVNGDFILDIYGTIKDKKYMEECFKFAEKNELKNISYCGVANHTDIKEIFTKYDLFFLPTLGENFGHSIYESLALGCPVLTTNNVIWTGLEENKAGWNYDLDDKGKYIDLIEKLIKCDGEEYKAMTGNCRGYLKGKINEEELVKKNIELFRNSDW